MATDTAERIDFIPDPGMSFWPTPTDVAHDLVYRALMPWHGRGEGVRVLEPSAGDGHLAAEIRAQLPEAYIVCVEPDPGRAAKLRSREDAADVVVESTLEDYLDAAKDAPFDLVIMNPPFTLRGRPQAWAEHVLALHNAAYLIAPGGVISAVVPRTVMTGRSRLPRQVRELAHPSAVSECEPDAFAPVGAQVVTALILIEKTEQP